MLLCMRTTVDIEDAILIRAKEEAARRHTSLKAVIEDALRQLFMGAKPRNKPYKFNPPIVKGHRLPEVDIADRNALYDYLDKNP